MGFEQEFEDRPGGAEGDRKRYGLSEQGVLENHFNVAESSYSEIESVSEHSIRAVRTGRENRGADLRGVQHPGHGTCQTRSVEGKCRSVCHSGKGRGAPQTFGQQVGPEAEQFHMNYRPFLSFICT